MRVTLSHCSSYISQYEDQTANIKKVLQRYLAIQLHNSQKELLNKKSTLNKPFAFSPCSGMDLVPVLLKTDCFCAKERKLWFDFVGYCADNLRNAPPQIRNDYHIVLFACKNNGLSLAFASYDLKNNIDIVQAAVEQSGLALAFAGDALRNDKKIALIAIRQNPDAIQFCSESLRRDPELLKYLTKDSK